MKQEQNINISQADFSGYLFWDVDRTKLSLDDSKTYVIDRVLSHGMLTDWQLIKAYYGKDAIREVALNQRYLDRYALHFCAAYFDEPLTNFRCYNYAQSNPGHWDY
ncbi:MAG: hypothetical protein IPN76_31370 [Saprospiraceae bacterium]|nr:hypothetical protein [Saprospiraceae bacterium]